MIPTWMQTYSGCPFHPMDPKAEDVDIVDIAHALSQICRFGGHCDRPYSVADHSLLVSDIVEELEPDNYLAQLWGLMHDSAEAYTGDIIRPIKYSSPKVTAILKGMEDKCLDVIAEALSLPLPIPLVVKKADNLALALECRDLMQGERAGYWNIPACMHGPGWGARTMHPQHAEEAFVREYGELKYKLEGK